MLRNNIFVHKKLHLFIDQFLKYEEILPTNKRFFTNFNFNICSKTSEN